MVTTRRFQQLFSVMALASTLLLGACAHSTIPRTNISDTEDNRAIYGLVEEYQRAMESLDAEAVLVLVSPTYYEDNGNRDRADDYSYEDLKIQLAKNFQRTRQLHLRVRIDAIEVKKDSAYAEVYYQIRAKNEYPAGEKWETSSDRARIQFAKSGADWLIVSGL